MSNLSDLDWQIRLAVYRRFAAVGVPPSFTEIAPLFGISDDEARAAYRRLHDGHALFLEPGTDTIRMANPLSAIPTSYQVYVDGRRLYANCAWDSLGIPAMRHADGRMEAVDAYTHEPLDYAIEGGALKAPTGLMVHFPLSFSRWYDDLIHT